MPYGTVNADVIQSSVTNASLGAGNSSIMKNRIINGAMVIDQRNAGASVTADNGVFGVDRFQTLASVSGKLNVQQNAGSVTPPAGFTNYVGYTSTSAYSVGASEVFAIAQKIEGFNTADLGWGTADAKTITISFLVRSSLTGTFSGFLQNSASTRSYVFSYSIPAANTWTYITATVAGDTSGTWIGSTNGIGIRLYFTLAAGSSITSSAGSWVASDKYGVTGTTSVVGTNGATFYITGVQLEVGTSATGFEYRMYGQELALCQRYYTTIAGGTQYMGGHAFSTNRVISAAFFPATMRANPTVTLAAGSFTYFINGAAYTSSATAVSATSTGNLQIDFTATATSGSNGAVATNNTISMSAEL